MIRYRFKYFRCAEGLNRLSNKYDSKDVVSFTGCTLLHVLAFILRLSEKSSFHGGDNLFCATCE